MNTYTVEYYDLLSRALGGNDSVRLQGFLDDVMAEKYNGLQIDGFEWETDMQTDFTYEQIQKEIGLNVMAQYVDVDAPAIPYGTQGFQIGTGKIPRQKGVEYFNEDKFRKMKLDEERFGADSDRVLAAAAEKLFNTYDTLIGGHVNSLTYQRHQIVSAGKLTLTDTNNPNGIQNVTFAAHVPSANVTNLSGEKRWWKAVADGIYSNEGTQCDPIKDMKEIVKWAKNKGIRGHFEVNDAYMDQILDHSKITAAIAARLYPTATDATMIASAIAILDNESKQRALEAIVGAQYKRIDSLVAVEKYNKTTKKLERPLMEAFERNVLVFVPDGPLGKILAVEPIAVGGTIGGFFGGRLQTIVDYDFTKKCQAFNTELTALVVPDKPQYMKYLHPYSLA